VLTNTQPQINNKQKPVYEKSDISKIRDKIKKNEIYDSKGKTKDVFKVEKS